MAVKQGRPSKYIPEFVGQAEKLCLLGATDPEIADFFGVNLATIKRWKHTHPEFCAAIKSGKDFADERVERSLFQRAIGYEQDEVKIFMPAGALQPVYAAYRAAIPADTTAAIFWLKNRRSAQWRDVKHLDGKQEVVHRYDLDRLGNERLDELERILADAATGAGGTGEAVASSVH